MGSEIRETLSPEFPHALVEYVLEQVNHSLFVSKCQWPSKKDEICHS